MITFGRKDPTLTYQKTIASYGILLDSLNWLGVPLATEEQPVELLGTPISDDETPEEALRRIFLSVTGYTLKIEAFVGQAEEYSEAQHAIGYFYLCRLDQVMPGFEKAKPPLNWLSPEKSKQRLGRSFQRYMVEQARKSYVE